MIKHQKMITTILLVTSSIFAQNNGITKDLFKLHKNDNQFKLIFDTDTFALNQNWLIPPAELEEYQGMNTSAFEFDSIVTSFKINDNLTGLNLSSYDILAEGSAQSASGKDVFLILHSNGTISSGEISLGLTKSRSRSEGAFYSATTHFVLADVDSNGSIDIGVIKEEIYYNRETVQDSIEGEWEQIEGPFFKQEPVEWYQFNQNRWNKSNFAILPDNVDDLPLIGLHFSPVDYVGHLQWNSYDPKAWSSENTDTINIYNPSYRTYMIENQVIHMP